jgi:hypothetical protein
MKVLEAKNRVDELLRTKHTDEPLRLATVPAGQWWRFAVRCSAPELRKLAKAFGLKYESKSQTSEAVFLAAKSET